MTSVAFIVMLNVNVLSVAMLNVVMLNVMVAFICLRSKTAPPNSPQTLMISFLAAVKLQNTFSCKFSGKLDFEKGKLYGRHTVKVA